MSAEASTPAPPTELRAVAYPPAWRIIAAILVSLSRGCLPLLLLTVLLARDPPITPPMLLRATTLLALMPGIAAWLIARAFAATLSVRGPDLVLQRRDLRLDVPCASIVRVTAWTVPLPGPGVSLWLRSGRRLRYGLQIADPTRLLAECGVAGAGATMTHPSLVYAHAKSVVGPWRWHHFLVKYVVFALVPTAVLFNAHQYIAYGGTLGQYYLLGLAAYLQTFFLYWTTLIIYLVLYASVLRGAVEALAHLAAWVVPARAVAVRRGAERLSSVLYYGGVPVLLALRFLA